MRRLYHVLEIADTAAVAVFGTLGLLVLKIFAQITEGTGALDLLDKLRHQAVALVKLRLHLCDILLC